MTGIDAALLGLALAFAIAMIRVARGPHVADRVVALDVCLYTVIAAIALLGVRQGAVAFFDVVLVATLLGFLATVAIARLVERDRT